MTDLSGARKVREDFVRIKTRTELLNELPARWAEQYPPDRYPNNGPSSHGAIREALFALDIWGRNRDRMNAIIGNNGWTEQRCERCNMDSDTIIQIGQEPDYDARFVDLCPTCIQEIASILKEKNDEPG